MHPETIESGINRDKSAMNSVLLEHHVCFYDSSSDRFVFFVACTDTHVSRPPFCMLLSAKVVVLTYDAVLALYSFSVEGGVGGEGGEVLTSPACEQRLGRWHASTCAMAFHEGERDRRNAKHTVK